MMCCIRQCHGRHVLAAAAVDEMPFSVENPYDILGLPRGCSKEEIKPAFRQLARELHPDVPETGNEEGFKHLLWAMRELSSERGRRRWGVPGDLTGASLQEISLEAEDFAFDMRDWPFEELEDLLRLSEEAMDVSDDAMQDVRSTWSDDGTAAPTGGCPADLTNYLPLVTITGRVIHTHPCIKRTYSMAAKQTVGKGWHSWALTAVFF
eukprot:Skav205928  [mRNA]  locus=scaffold123:1109098:1115291:+ [translate_table: standard]